MTRTRSRTQEILEREARHYSGLWQPDIVFVKGEGVKLWDAEGKEYLDCMAGIAVASIGHANPRLKEAIAEQAGKLIAFSQNVGNDTRADFLDKLFSFVPAPLNRVFLANSGSEVNEAALKWARAATGKTRFVAAMRGFSGRTMGAVSLTWEKKYREPFGKLIEEVDFIPFNNVEKLEEAITDETAAVFLEPIQGEGGVRPRHAQVLTGRPRLDRRPRRTAHHGRDSVRGGAHGGVFGLGALPHRTRYGYARQRLGRRRPHRRTAHDR